MTLKYSVINIARHFDATFSQILKMVAVKPTFVSIFLIGIWHFAQAGRVRRMDSSIIEVNGKLGMYLNVPSQCYTIYDSIIERLEACKSGRNLGHPNLDQGCLIQVSRSTVWKLSHFSVTLVLREINFGCHFINQNWFHVKSKWQKNLEFFPHWEIRKLLQIETIFCQNLMLKIMYHFVSISIE